MTKGPEWLAANDHPKAAGPTPVRPWVRPRGKTWYRPVASEPDAPDVTAAAPSRHRLIAAGRVTGAPVYARQGRRVGRIADIAIDDATGEVAFVLLAEGGFLGFGERLRRLPWSSLSYQAGRGGYRLDLGEATLQDVLNLCGKVTFQGPADRSGWAADAPNASHVGAPARSAPPPWRGE